MTRTNRRTGAGIRAERSKRGPRSNRPRAALGNRRALGGPSPHGLDRAFRQGADVRNPYSRRYAEGRAFERLREGLAREQSVASFQDLPRWRRLLTHRLVILQHRLAHDDAEMIANPGTRGKNEDRVIAYTNAMIRIVALLGMTPAAEESDLGTELARLTGGARRP